MSPTLLGRSQTNENTGSRRLAVWRRQTVASVPVVVPPAHHVLIVGGGGDLKPLDVFIGAKKQGVIPRCVVRRPDQEAAHLADWWMTG